MKFKFSQENYFVLICVSLPEVVIVGSNADLVHIVVSSLIVWKQELSALLFAFAYKAIARSLNSFLLIVKFLHLKFFLKGYGCFLLQKTLPPPQLSSSQSYYILFCCLNEVDRFTNLLFTKRMNNFRIFLSTLILS